MPSINHTNLNAEAVIKQPSQDPNRSPFLRQEQWRFFLLVATMAGAFSLAAVVAISFVVPQGSLDAAFIAASTVTLLASTALTVMSFRLAARRARYMPRAKKGVSLGIGRAALIAFGLVAVIGNIAAALSGHFFILNWILAALVAALILLIRYRDQHKQPPPDR